MGVRTFAVAVSLAFLLAKGASAQLVSSSEEQRAEAVDTYQACLDGAANQYDDAVSELDSVIAKVAQQCADKFASLKETLSAGLGGAMKEKFESDMDANRLPTVRDTVLRHRHVGAANSAAGSS